MDRVSRGQQTANREEQQELEARRLRGVAIAIRGSFVLNVAIFIAKVVAVAISGSISLIASAVDSFLDLISGSIIFLTACVMRRSSQSPYLYPAGNSRIEPIGIIVFATAMFVATFLIIVEAVEKIIELASLQKSCVPIDYTSVTCNATCPALTYAGTCQTLTLDALTLSIIGGTIIIKLLMYLYCIGYRNKSSSVRALATDHASDVVSNSLLLAAYVMAYYVWGFLDPMGGLAISFYLQVNWYREGAQEVAKLSGQSAPPEFLSQITFLTWQHSPLIVAVDTVRAYHLANGYLVEVDVVLPHDMLLRDAHDVGESLQLKLESLESVERAFVHLDWEHDHVPAREHPAAGREEGFASSHEEEDALLIPLEQQWNRETKL